MFIECCAKCDINLYDGHLDFYVPHTDYFLCKKCNQPDSSKREDSSNDEMRYSEHDSNIVREVQ